MKNIPRDQVDPTQDVTLFQLIPVSNPSISGIPYGSFVRIQHVLTQCWMHTANDEEEGTTMEPPNFNAFTAISPVSSSPKIDIKPSPSLSLRQHARFNSTESTFSTVIDSHINTHNVVAKDMDSSSTYYPITASQELYYHDCFSITLVEEPLVDTFNSVNDMMPQLQSYLHFYQTASTDEEIPYSQLESIAQILKTLICFCTKSKETDPTKRVGIPIMYHQNLLREIGIIGTIMDMIKAPFHLTKRQDRDFQETNDRKGSSSDQNVSNPELRIVLTLCYHLLRVFLIRKSSFEAEEEDSMENQMYVYTKATEKAMIPIFVQHLMYNIGATDMMIELAQVLVNDKVLVLLDPLVVGRAIATTSSGLIEQNLSKSVHAVNWILLLNALCRKASASNISSSHISSSLLAFRDNVVDQLFTLGGECLLQTRLTTEKKHMEVAFGKNDTWFELNALINEYPHMLGYLESVLELMCSLSHKSNAKTIEIMSMCISKDICLKSLKNNKLPPTLRSKFCDLIRGKDKSNV